MHEAREVSRLTLITHRALEERALSLLQASGANTILVETSLCLRQVLRPRRWLLPGSATSLRDAPMVLIRTTVAREGAARLLQQVTAGLELETPGRGQAYLQHLREWSQLEPPEVTEAGGRSSVPYRDLALITAILSRIGSGEQLAKTALDLGAALPVIARGIGTGIRDRLGLIRITIPPEKELVQLLVPGQDAPGLIRLLIEEGRMDRPGGGFLYQTPVAAGMVDPLLRIGQQAHAASLEQIIAAVDELKQSTSWRKRFAGVEETQVTPSGLRRNHRELTLVCAEGAADPFVAAAMRSGASGATTSRVRCVNARAGDGGFVARERSVFCVPGLVAEAVQHALQETAERMEEDSVRLQVLEAPAVFTHQPRRR